MHLSVSIVLVRHAKRSTHRVDWRVFLHAIDERLRRTSALPQALLRIRLTSHSRGTPGRMMTRPFMRTTGTQSSLVGKMTSACVAGKSAMRLRAVSICAAESEQEAMAGAQNVTHVFSLLRRVAAPRLEVLLHAPQRLVVVLEVAVAKRLGDGLVCVQK